MRKEIKKWSFVYLSRKSDLILFDDYTIETNYFGIPKKMSANELMTYWYGFSDDKAIEMQILIELLYLIPIEYFTQNMKLLSRFYNAYNNPAPWQNKQVRPDQLFFTGTRNYNLSVEEKIARRNGIVACVSPNFTLQQAFKIFDLRNASWRRDVKNDSGGEDYLYLKDGYVVYGGYHGNGRDGGEGYHDAESIYYCPEESFDIITNRRYQGVQQELKMFFEGFVV